MKSTKDRLIAVMRDGNLRVSDLARWFGRPHATVRLWWTGNSDVGGTLMDKAFILERLVQLERMVHKKGILIPQGLTPKQRIEALEGVIKRRDYIIEAVKRGKEQARLQKEARDAN